MRTSTFMIMLSFMRRYNKRARSDPWISDRIRRYFFCRRFTVGTSLSQSTDTRTHVVGEIYDTEVSYVESLQILVNKYKKPLERTENAALVEKNLVDEIFYKIPEILMHHESFLESVRQRISYWDSKQKIGDLFVDVFTKQCVIDTYTAFINNWKPAKEAIKLASQAKPAFAKFLQHMAREHKGKLTLDALLIMPVQRIPRYELLIKELLKHTHVDHPDYQLLVLAQKEIHDLAVKINRMEREAFQHERMLQRMKELEHLIEGATDLVQPDRTFIRYDVVNITEVLGIKNESCIFLFSDLLIITSVKKRSGTIRKPSSSSNSPTSFGTLETNKYKMLMMFPLDNLAISKNTDTNIKKAMKEIENLENDISLLGRINELIENLNCQHQILDEAMEDVMATVSKQLLEKQTTDPLLLSLQLTAKLQDGEDIITITYPTSEKRSSWEAAFNEAKQKLAHFTDKQPPPEFYYTLPIHKTRAGLQFTCATAVLGLNQLGRKDVWICNSDGYTGQVCVISLLPEPSLISCSGICNARITCITSIPTANSVANRRRSLMPESSCSVSTDIQDIDSDTNQSSSEINVKFNRESSTDDDANGFQDDDSSKKPSIEYYLSREDSEELMYNNQPTMWLGTEEGCIHIYNCNDNICIKKHRLKIQHPASVHCILYLDNRVFVALANGEICVYHQNFYGGWNITDPQHVLVGSVAAPVTKMLATAGKMWCGCQTYIKVLNTTNLEIEHSFQVTRSSSKTMLCMVASGLGVWLAIQNSAILKLFHATTYEDLLEINVSPAVTQMLSRCDDIIRQHKAACLRVTALLACKDMLWIGTSAGVILTIALPHLTITTSKLDHVPKVSGIPHGHTGHVHFLTHVEMTSDVDMDIVSSSKYMCTHQSNNKKDGETSRTFISSPTSHHFLVISGGDGYENFSVSGPLETVGQEDSTNHLLLWKV
ncbi:rho guanine nucleotide exchange factor 17 isoform X3 [Tachypleus tridentatus]|uniref:rho guanine nucleotide exchange factor 17 isoform X3 n=1 Tax=Tachypleus tridentatus TaxID=6853 RepID=UPI003FCF9D1B